jgi:hypothetical protein
VQNGQESISKPLQFHMPTLPASHKHMKITLNTPLKNITGLFQSFGITFELSANNNNEDFQIEIPA